MRALLLALLLAAAGNAFAEPYTWLFGSQRFGSAQAACQAWFDSFPQGPEYHLGVFVNEARADCLSLLGNMGQNASAVVYRSGDSCPEKTTYNPSTGACDPDKQACEVGMTGLFRSTNAPILTINGRNIVASTPPTGCKATCEYVADSSKPTSCYRTPGSDTEGFCNYSLKSTGNNCAADSNNPGGVGPSLNDAPPPPDTQEPPSDPKDPGCGPGYSWSGTTCVKTPTDPNNPNPNNPNPNEPPKDPGDGSGNGNGNGNGNGSGNGNGNGNGDGSGNGNGNGNGSGDGNGDGSGNGNGNCNPATDPNKCQGSSVGGESCDAQLACTGDAITCAILRQEKAQRCLADKMFGEDKNTDLESLGRGFGDKVQEGFADGADTYAEGEGEALTETLGQADDKLEEVFGKDGRGLDKHNVLDKIMPKASSCSDIKVSFNFRGKTFNINLPVCELSRMRAILEYVLYALTGIYLWDMLVTIAATPMGTARRGRR
ncbi:hypothetical protein [Pseudomonas mangiferae]|uniref:Attachment protein n=1 Tax=Pseudomonas mangiferae TaxID=2593654 RepID=A0A553H1L5_9PSED|nr:hypothetical protein [Pseudomonas mangiferae]TRX75646.1 hypothetical protein FM069_07850 [Pseudomonas mangiferae]